MKTSELAWAWCMAIADAVGKRPSKVKREFFWAWYSAMFWAHAVYVGHEKRSSRK